MWPSAPTWIQTWLSIEDEDADEDEIEIEIERLVGV
jgi:hypothetical protein